MNSKRFKALLIVAASMCLCGLSGCREPVGILTMVVCDDMAQIYECMPDQVCCNGCADPESFLKDKQNCGSCGHVCSADAACVNGHCTCPSGQDSECGEGFSCCDGFCIDLSSNDMGYCGSCNMKCPDPSDPLMHVEISRCTENGCEIICSEGYENADGDVSNGCEQLICGNGRIDAGEMCDGNELNNETCVSILGPKFEGNLACSADCQFDTSGCTEIILCGNGVIDEGEQCDGENLNGATCASFLGNNFEGTLACLDTCFLDASGCKEIELCGNGQLDDGEKCDGELLNGATCQSVLGNDFEGTVSCTSNCLLNTSKCKSTVVPPDNCGNGQLDKGELCDGNHLNCETCETILGKGYSGTLRCNLTCNGYDTNKCFKLTDKDDACLIESRDCSDYLAYTQNLDSSATIKANVALQLAKSMDICMDVVTEASKLPGLIEYSVSKSDEKRSEVFSRQVNIKSNMRAANGVVKIAPHAGKDFVLLSSGHAEDVLGGVNSSDDSFESKGIIPAAYRKIHNGVLQTHPLCESGGGNIFDTVRLHLKMRAPKTARGIQFDFRFFSREYPYYMCSMFNDFFLALLTDANGRPIVDKDGDGEVLDEDANISFDALGNPISVNNATFTTCAAPKCGSSFFSESAYCPANLTCSNNHCGSCEDGYDAVKAYYPNPYTGLGSSFEFGDSRGGGTAWLTTKAPIKPGEVFNLDFYIWDTGDSVFDSSVILDNFQWICTDTEISTEIVCEKEQ